MVAWAVAMHDPDRCRGVVSLTVPHFARGIGLKTLLPLINRSVYPKAKYHSGQSDYQFFYQEHFTKAVRDFEANRELLIPRARSRVRMRGVRAEEGSAVLLPPQARTTANSGTPRWLGR